jgi:hypothetical protein
MERFSASQASKFMACPGAGNLELAIPHWVPPVDDRTADTAANRGTNMHDKFAGVMSLSTKDIKMMALALEYVAEVRATRKFQVLIEQPVYAEWLSTRPGTTADLVLYVADEIHIFDLKTGVTPVYPEENYQLLYYALCYGGLAPKAKGVHLHIVQPWAGFMGSWFASAERLQLFLEEAQRTELKLIEGDTTLTPGDHCTFCPANPHGRGLRGRPYCPAMMSVFYPRVETDDEEILNGD